MTLVQKEIKWIYTWTGEEVSDMQWPCPEGFHVPLDSEWTNIINAGVTLWAWTSWTPLDLSMKLKIPLAWVRYTNDGSTTNQSTNWHYRTCKFRMSNWYPWAYDFSINSVMYEVQGGVITSWNSIRPFKNTAVVPDGSWTTIYQWTWSAGIFHNATLGLISISSDGTTWYTIADKNLWATTVWNSWDALSESNCWKYYQRWNNYWFPRTWSVTTSTTKVSAADYWPWNYYSSNTFICVTARPYNRDSSNNDNLRWWVTQWSWTVLTEHKIRPSYKREPTADTLFYYEFEQNWTDSSGKGNNATPSNVTYELVWWQYVVKSVANSSSVSFSWALWASIGTWDFTASFWLYPINPWSSSYWWYNCPMVFGFFNWNNYPYVWPSIFYDPRWQNWWWDKFLVRTSGNANYYYWNASSLYNWWHHIVFTRISWTAYFYVDSVLQWSFASTDNFSTTNLWYVFSRYESNWRQYWWSAWAKWDKYILEKKWWTAQEISDYYNSTKSIYWL